MTPHVFLNLAGLVTFFLSYHPVNKSRVLDVNPLGILGVSLKPTGEVGVSYACRHLYSDPSTSCLFLQRLEVVLRKVAGQPATGVCDLIVLKLLLINIEGVVGECPITDSFKLLGPT